MIQRIQTVFLLFISIVTFIGFFLLPPIDFLSQGLPTSIVLETYLFLTSGISFLTMILFKRRKIQLFINRFHYFFQIVSAIGLVYGISHTNDLKTYLPWLAIPILVLILLLLSNNAIKKDEDLIRSIDRLR